MALSSAQSSIVGPVAAFTPPSPLGYLQTYGPRANPATALTWGLLDISVAVIVIMTALVVGGVLVRQVRVCGTAPKIQRGPSGLTWLYVGLSLTVTTLVVALVWTVEVIAQINSPAVKPALTLEITGHQWWWDVRYLADDPTQTFDTANEIHIPVGRPILIKLTSADVIHSFWTPALTGKTDTIPGRTNLTWLEADRPGLYFGQCTEFCGVQHAHMALSVVAQSPAAFEAWRRAQVQPAAAMASGPGEAVFQAHCSVCHAVRGTEAGGVVGPDLTHLMSRQTVASGLLPNNVATLSGWISNPQALKPGAKMPATNLSGADLAAVTAYLQALK